MPDKNQRDKYIDQILNVKSFAILAILIMLIIGASELKQAWKEITPQRKEKYCNREEAKLKSLSDKILNVDAHSLDYGGILVLKTDVDKFLDFQNEDKDFFCESHDLVKQVNIDIKDKLLSITFSLVEEWKKTNSSEEIREKVEYLCRISKKFLEATAVYSEKEMNVINSTLTLLSK